MLDDFIVSSSTARRHPAHFAMMAREGNGFPLFEPGNMGNASDKTQPFSKSFESLGRSVRQSGGLLTTWVREGLDLEWMGVH